MTNRISKTECIALYKIEVHFLDALVEAGLLAVIVEKEEYYIHFDELNNLEKMANLHYDLDINIAGIEVISRLLEQIKLLQTENNHLKQNQINTSKLTWEDFN